MAGTVETDLVFFTGATGGSSSNCDAITDWAVAPTLDTDIFVQGTGALSIKVSKATVTSVFALSGAVDLRGKMIYFWAFTLLPSILATKAQGGIRLRLESSATAYCEWNIAGNDTWSGAWTAFAQHCDTAGSIASTFNLQYVRSVGFTFTTSALAKITPNIFWDAIRYGTYLGIREGTEGAPATFDDMITAEQTVSTGKYGVLERTSGILFCQGKLKFGNTNTFPTYFKDTVEALVFKDPPNTIPLDWFSLVFQGNATGVTTVSLGNKSGAAGISGDLFRRNTYPYKVTVTDTNVNTLGIYGCNFFQGNTIEFQAYNAYKEVLNSIFEQCQPIYTQETVFTNCNFIGSPTIATVVDDTGFKVTSSNFIANTVGMELISLVNGSTIVFNGLKFTANALDLKNSTGNSINVSCINGSNPTTQSNPLGGTLNIYSSLTILVKVKEPDGDPIVGARVYIFQTGTPSNVILDGETNAQGEVTTGYTGPNINLTIRVRQSSLAETRYYPVETYSALAGADWTLDVTMYVDPNV